jgi:hypothetical protein
MPWWKVGGWVGIVFVIAEVTLNLSEFDTPMWDDPIADIRQFFDGDLVTWGLFLEGLLFAFLFLIFASYLRSFLREAEGERGVWSRLSYSGALIAVVVGAIGSVFWGALSLGSVTALDDASLRAFLQMDAVAYGIVSSLGFAIFTLGTSAVIMGTGLFPRWIAWLGYTATAALALGTAWIIEGKVDGAFGMISLIGWLLAIVFTLSVAIAMVRHHGFDLNVERFREELERTPMSPE